MHHCRATICVAAVCLISLMGHTCPNWLLRKWLTQGQKNSQWWPNGHQRACTYYARIVESKNEIKGSPPIFCISTVLRQIEVDLLKHASPWTWLSRSSDSRTPLDQSPSSLLDEGLHSRVPRPLPLKAQVYPSVQHMVVPGLPFVQALILEAHPQTM